jgi:aminoglycoside phosphotransferase (APT) family kinase protein
MAVVTHDAPVDLTAVVLKLGANPADLIGRGGEAWVFALDADRAVRVLRPGGRLEDLRRRKDLLDELAMVRAPCRIPEIMEVGEFDGRVYAIERRLPGRSVFDVLASDHSNARPRLIETYLDAVASLGDLHLEPRQGFGELIRDDPVRRPTWRAYLAGRAATNLAKAGPEFRSVDWQALADALPEPDVASFVHLDAFVGNVLTDGRTVTAIIDIGPTSLAGDRRLDPLSAVAYLDPAHIPVVTPTDMGVARSWARNAGLEEWVEPAKRWLAAFWVIDDPNLVPWCREVLLKPK